MNGDRLHERARTKKSCLARCPDLHAGQRFLYPFCWCFFLPRHRNRTRVPGVGRKRRRPHFFLARVGTSLRVVLTDLLIYWLSVTIATGRPINSCRCLVPLVVTWQIEKSKKMQELPKVIVFLRKNELTGTNARNQGRHTSNLGSANKKISPFSIRKGSSHAHYVLVESGNL